jgi:hypothetical protein
MTSDGRIRAKTYRGTSWRAAISNSGSYHRDSVVCGLALKYFSLVSISARNIAGAMKPATTILFDNGASAIKAGLLGTPEKEPRHVASISNNTPSHNLEEDRIIPNAVVRSKGDKMTYFGHEVERCRDYASLHYRLPFEKVRRK